MGMTTENTAQGRASLRTTSRDDYPNLEENLMRYSLVMSFADKLLSREVLSPKEYADFSVETAQLFDIKMLQNPCVPTR